MYTLACNRTPTHAHKQTETEQVLDTDKSGSLSSQEFTAAMRKLVRLWRERTASHAHLKPHVPTATREHPRTHKGYHNHAEGRMSSMVVATSLCLR